MKHHFFATLVTAAVFGLCLGSCQKNQSPEDTPAGVDEFGNEISAEEIFWSVVGQLVDRTQRTADYKGKTFQPTIGEASDGDASVRVVYVNDLGAAVERFNNLVGAEITETTSSYTYSNKEVGTLTWTLTNDGRSWGTVDVSIAQVPTLQKIIYRSPGQDDANGGVRGGGSAYYRFGDVIKRVREEDGVTEYWVCVRPSFDPEGKGDSHWISVSPLPKSNVWPYYDPDYNYGPFIASNKMEYGMPYNLGDDLEWLQDLAEMLFAIMYPKKWDENLESYYKSTLGVRTGLRMFNDFDYPENVHYHNKAFWTNVQNKWKEKDIVRKVFGIPYEEMASAIDPKGNGRGLHLLYKGYSWSKTVSNKPTLYQVHYSNSTSDGKKMNMHNQVKTSVVKQVVDPKKTQVSAINFPLDVYKLKNNAVPYLVESRFFGDTNPRWIVRYATGDELSSSGNYDPQLPIPGFNTRDNEVYRYYHDVYPDKDLMEPPETTVDTDNGFSGRAHYRVGNVYTDEKGAKWFVINQAGYDSGMNNPAVDERSPYSELISFDPAGFEVSSGNGKVTNLPSLDVAIRVFPFLYPLTSAWLGHETSEYDNNQVSGYTMKNILENAGVDIRTLVQSYISHSLGGVHYRPGQMTSIAYNTQGGNQALLRVVVNGQNERKDAKFYYWTKYPFKPDLETQFVTDFSQNLIFLQDIANDDYVKKYAPDTYARQPLSQQTDPNSDETTPRPIRQAADQRALNVRNYFYDLNTFRNRQYPGSMWNEPILFFRYTRVRDSGDSDFDTRTQDGHTLTLYKERIWEDNVYNRDNMYDLVKNFVANLWITVSNDAMFLNGQSYVMPRWQDINIKQ